MNRPITPIPLSHRTTPLTEDEIRAALRAIHRILVVARGLANDHAAPSVLANILDATEILPQSLLRPAEFDDLFRPTLDSLAASYPEFRGLRDEFAEATA